ncbi:mucoidy inhibitor MuiA family protein [Aggregicoccus sp. 17bor-14]|uniref:mucoidy inhibitor MuiA family protein n=1 Tax=Myxococcaceae TaxID=31 RepID=UPI00129C4844|nr:MULTISPECIES: mucoidy inhibitor MuiA family protein [Myxococcaceae]MBF5043758.1 mucoidy inhibitor MuiA family protein [Simulacricoccus sp. 17bor-14]MRI89512.1 mucoidy inhibitor MuiA family protein [Aggregicoccus sp. 17bor-14]
MLLLLLPALGTLTLGAIDAPVTDVTVFSDRARVVRTARVSLSGTERVELPLLREGVDPESIRVEADGAEVLRVDIRPVSRAAFAADPARKVLAELERLDDALTRARAEKDAYEAQLKAVAGLQPQAPESPVDAPPPRLNATGWSAAVSFVVETTERLQARVREVEEHIAQLEQARERQAEEAARLGNPQRQGGLAVVPVLRGHGAATLRLSYATPRARWFPAYELRLLPEANRVEVAFSGLVSQESGEDWTNAQLTLSTALPSGATAVPRLSTWKVGQKERFIPTPETRVEQVRAPPPELPPLRAQVDADLLLRRRLLALVGKEPEDLSIPEPAPPEEPHDASGQRAPPPSAPPPRPTQGIAPGQGQSFIVGVVSDASTKQPAADVVVTATSPNISGEQVVVTDADGRYRIPQLPPGNYSLRFEKESFQPYSRSGVQLRADRTIRVNVELLPAGLQETLVVQGTAPSIDVGSTSTGVNVGADFVRGVTVTRPSGSGGAARSFEGLTGSSSQSEAVLTSVGLAPPAGWVRPQLDARLPAESAGGRDLDFRAARPETVRTGGSLRQVPLFSESWPVKVERELYPALAQDAFLVAELKSPARQVLPGGDAQLYVGADPAGSARLQVVAPGEPFTLPLGLDRAVHPARNVQQVTAERGFIGKDEVTEYLTTIEVANPYPFALPVRVHDQWPLSRSEDVQVRLLSTEPYAEQDEVKGALTWRLTVPPSGKTTVSFRYSVRRPKGWRLHQQQ